MYTYHYFERIKKCNIVYKDLMEYNKVLDETIRKLKQEVAPGLCNGFVHTGTKKFDHLPFTIGYLEFDL